MEKFIKSTEQVALILAVAILALSGLSFSLSHQLGQAQQTRFLFSGIVLGLTSVLLRYGFVAIQPLHRASYRLALVMMVWSIGFYFFPYPHMILYLVVLPGLYFLMRVEVKKHAAPKEDLIAAGILLGLAIFLYFQQQPLQLILFDTPTVDWTVYYSNAPCMVLVGLAFLRFQYWLKWDGLALMGVFITLLASILSLSLVTHAPWLELKELVYFVLLAHVLLAFIFVPNPLYLKLLAITAVGEQKIDFPRSVFWLVFALAQLCVLVIMQFFWLDPIFVKPLYQVWADSTGNLAWYLPLLTGSLLLMLYCYRQWTVSLLFFESAVIGGMIAVKISVTVFGFSSSEILCALLALMLFVMAQIKRQVAMAHTIRLWSFVGVLVVYGLTFVQTAMFTPLGFAGFLLPVCAWLYLPDKPSMPIRNLAFYAWPGWVLIAVLCFALNSGFAVLTLWALLTVAVPLAFSLALLNEPLQRVMVLRNWRLLQKWQRLESRLLPVYALFSVVVCAASFYFNRADLALHWQPLLLLWLAIVLSACGVLKAAIRTRTTWGFGLAESILWAAMGLIRWKLDVISALALGSAIDGYLFIGLAIAIAGVREKAKQYNRGLASYFTKTTLLYAVVGWLYLIYLYWAGGAAIHGQLASLAIAGIFYWLSRQVSQKLQLFVFAFANIALFLFFDEFDFHNPLFYLTPVLISALALTQLFKDELTAFQVKQIRFYCGLLLLGLSAAYNLLDFSTSIWYPVAAVILAALIVVVGISLRIRIFLYLGSGFFLVNIAGMIANVILTQPDGRTMFAVGLLFFVMGVLFIGTYLLFQMKREAILLRYRSVMETVDTWEG